MKAKRGSRRPDRTKSAAGILLIGLFKLVKGFALLAIGVGALRLLHRDVAQQVNHWVQVLRVDPENHYVHLAMSRVANVSPRQLREVSAGTFFYAALLLTEGIGLLRRKHWAEYFTVISTALLIPLEVYELARHLTPAKVAVLAINILIVIYLAMRLRRAA
ncbi:MAG: DUF2127 domain-containing protein [Acidobacteriota bacterium]|nr:DUF2127 domain-containing protein [Acidobacteriota bacterium]